VDPIFVHSLFRSGSTYVFNAFRRSTSGYWCYQEPLNEYVRHVASTPERLLEIDGHDASLLRHPLLERPYFWEFYQVRNAIAALFRKEFSYDGFFMAADHSSFGALTGYLQRLIDSANGRPFLQCCRTFGRVAALRDTLGGTHIHLWRNPHDQWWSYQVGDYFDATTQLIYNAADLPTMLAAVKEICVIPSFHDQDIDEELAHARGHRLAARDSYIAFYALWMYSLLACEQATKVSINIDSLSSSSQYRQQTLSALTVAGIGALDFSDCSIAQAQFGAADMTFFSEGEDVVHALFQRHGVTTDEIATSLDLRARHASPSRRRVADLVASSTRVRDVAIRQMNVIAETQRSKNVQHADLVAAADIAASQRQQITSIQAALTDREKELAQSLARSSALAEELAGARRQVMDTSNALDEARARLDTQELALASMRQRSERLYDELKSVGTKLQDADRETHRWWTVADDTSRHLQSIYTSRSWRLTAPLRKVNAWRKRIVETPGIGTAALAELPRRAVRLLLLAAWSHAHDRPERRALYVRLLSPFPRLYARLRGFAFAHALVSAAVTRASQRALPDLPATSDDIAWDDYPISVREVHAQLMRARDAGNGTAVQRTPASMMQ
jgi:hypothetical protein